MTLGSGQSLSPDARSPFERAANFGFRCVNYSPGESLAEAGAELVAFENKKGKPNLIEW